MGALRKLRKSLGDKVDSEDVHKNSNKEEGKGYDFGQQPVQDSYMDARNLRAMGRRNCIHGRAYRGRQCKKNLV